MIGDSDRFVRAMAGAASRGIVLLLACLPAAARADALGDGTDAFARKDYASAMRLLVPLLQERADPVAGCMVTVMLDQARGRVAYDAEGMAATCIAAAQG